MPKPAAANFANLALLSISLKAKSTALVLLVVPVASITLANNPSSMNIVTFMPSFIWHHDHIGKDFLQLFSFDI